MKACILVANASRADLYVTENPRTTEWEKVYSFQHEKSRLRKRDLITNDWGGSISSPGARSACERTDPKAVEAENFALELHDHLKKVKKQFPDHTALIVASGPHFQGLLKKQLDDSTFEDIIFIPKNYVLLKPETLITRVQEYLYG